MEDWKIRYLHEKAIRDSQCVSRGIDIPEDPEFGTLTAPPKNLFRYFNGRTFWKEMDDRGHSSFDLMKCKCRQ